MRALIDPKGEAFAFVEGSRLYTLDGVLTGHIQGELVVDLSGSPVWRLYGDGVYTLNGMRSIGFLSEERPGDDN